MKSPKFVIYTDHKANWNNKDEYIDCSDTNFMDVFAKASELVNDDETIYLVRIYEVVKNTRCKKYKRIANVTQGYALQRFDGEIIERHNEYNTVWYE